MKRGGFVTVAVSGNYGKHRPALVVPSDFLRETDSVLVSLLTITPRNAPFYRLLLPVGEATGLQEAFQVMVDKIIAVRRDRCGTPIGRADDTALLALGRLLAFVVGIAD